VQPPLIVPLRSRKHQRAQLGQTLQHVTPGIVLLIAGAQTLTRGPHGFELALALFQVASSVLLLGSIVKTVRGARHLLRGKHSAHHTHVAHPTPHRIGWTEIFVSAVLAAEGMERWQVRHKLFRPAFLTAVVMLVLGLFHGRITAAVERRRSLRVSGTDLFVGGRPFKARKIRATWAELASIEVGERWAVITTRGGRVRKLDLSDLEGAEQVRHALAEAQRRLNLYRSISCEG